MGQQAPRAVIYAKSHVTNLRLNYKFLLSQRRNLRPLSQEPSDQHQWGHLPDRQCHPLQEGDRSITNLPFCYYNLLIPDPFCL